MSNGNHRLPAWLAGITALVATAGVALAQEPNATGDSEAAAIAALKECTSLNGGTSGRCDETQSGQTARDEREDAAQSSRDEDALTQAAQRDDRDDAPAPRDETAKGFDEESSRSVARDDTSTDDSQAESAHLAGHSADETQQTRVVPPAHATPSHPSMSGATASSGTSGQDNGESTSAANASDANSATWQNEDRSPQNLARARESAGSSERDTDYDNDRNGNPDEQDASDRSEAMASGQDAQSTRSVPPEHATRMPENDRASSETAANERAAETGSASDEYRNDANAPSRTDTYASQPEERDDRGNDREAVGAGTSSAIASSSAIQSQFDALDTDHDGTIDAAEAAVSTTLRAQFFTLDSDSDGKISLSEFKGASDIASIRADRARRRE